jgi:hypothetical protein
MLGETASGTVVMAAFGGHLDRAVPLTVRADITYRKVATGALRATARLGRPADEVIAELAAGSGPSSTCWSRSPGPTAPPVPR